MTVWKARRFWSEVSAEPEGAGWSVRLDGRPLRTPAKNALILPGAAMAEAVVEEWLTVEDEVDPRRMPVTRAANAAVDKVRPKFAEVAALIAAYGGTDHLCYRAAEPDELALAQSEAWDPMLNWARDALGADLVATRGVVPVDQPQVSLKRLNSLVAQTTEFQLAALHDLVSLTGSLVLGLAATRSDFGPERLWSLSRIDEDWQARQWGEDEEAARNAARKKQSFLLACDFWKLASQKAE